MPPQALFHFDGIALVRVLHSARDIPSQFESE
jgi:hypothetical protein